MNRKSTLTAAGVLMILLALVIGYLGLFSAPSILLPPVITAIGFIVIAWVFLTFRKGESA
ncbi:MAG: hypothetical protein WKF34_11275 [Pyrinomonadaceae bacterium]